MSQHCFGPIKNPPNLGGFVAFDYSLTESHLFSTLLRKQVAVATKPSLDVDLIMQTFDAFCQGDRELQDCTILTIAIVSCSQYLSMAFRTSSFRSGVV